jgi:hypothetical protein
MQLLFWINLYFQMLFYFLGTLLELHSPHAVSQTRYPKTVSYVMCYQETCSSHCFLLYKQLLFQVQHQAFGFFFPASEEKLSQCPSCFEVQWRLSLKAFNTEPVSQQIGHTIGPISVNKHRSSHSCTHFARLTIQIYLEQNDPVSSLSVGNDSKPLTSPN